MFVVFLIKVSCLIKAAFFDKISKNSNIVTFCSQFFVGEGTFFNLK